MSSLVILAAAVFETSCRKETGAKTPTPMTAVSLCNYDDDKNISLTCKPLTLSLPCTPDISGGGNK